MTEEEQRLLLDIRAHPNEETPRRMYARWLDEHGQGDRAALIRVQLGLEHETDLSGAALTESQRDATLAALLQEEARLLRTHGDEWARPLRDLGASKVEYRGGLPYHVDMSASSFLKNAGQVFRIAPTVQSVTITELQTDQLSDFANAAALANVTELGLPYFGLGSDDARTLAGSPHLCNVTTLNLACNNLGPDGIKALAGAPQLSNLTSLDLSGNEIGDDGVTALPHSPYFHKLERLRLECNGIGNRGAEALATSAHLGSLQELDLSDNCIDSEGEKTLVRSAALSDLAELNLRGGDIGMWALEEVERLMGRNKT